MNSLKCQCKKQGETRERERERKGGNKLWLKQCYPRMRLNTRENLNRYTMCVHSAYIQLQWCWCMVCMAKRNWWSRIRIVLQTLTQTHRQRSTHISTRDTSTRIHTPSIQTLQQTYTHTCIHTASRTRLGIYALSHTCIRTPKSAILTASEALHNVHFTL